VGERLGVLLVLEILNGRGDLFVELLDLRLSLVDVADEILGSHERALSDLRVRGALAEGKAEDETANRRDRGEDSGPLAPLASGPHRLFVELDLDRRRGRRARQGGGGDPGTERIGGRAR